MARRRFQRGSLIPKTGKPKDGLWRGRWREDVIQDGEVKRVYRWEIIGTFDEYPTRRLAERALQDRLSDVNSRSYRPTTTLTFRQLTERWEKSYLNLLNPSVQASERSRLNKHILPFFSKLELKDIDSLQVQRFIATSKCGPKSVKNNVNLLRQLHKFAKKTIGKDVDWFDEVKLPKIPKREMPHFTADEMKRIIQNAEGAHRLFYWILGETGIRLGECCALTTSALDLDRNAVVIQASAWQGKLGGTKTGKRRQFPISSLLRDRLRIYVMGMAPGAYLFSTKNNTPWNGSDLVKDHLRPLLLKLKIKTFEEVDGEGNQIVKVLPDVGAHAFRHGNCSLMLQQHVSAKVIQDRLGHSNFERLSLERYGHAESEDHIRAAEGLGAEIAPSERIQ